MHWIRKNWLALVVLLAIVGSYYVSNHDSKARDRAQQAQLVKGCQSNSYRTALGAAGWRLLSERVRERNNTGDPRSADIYGSVSTGMAERVPAPPGLHDPKYLISAHYDPAKKELTLSPAALALQRGGCEALYK